MLLSGHGHYPEDLGDLHAEGWPMSLLLGLQFEQLSQEVLFVLCMNLQPPCHICIGQLQNWSHIAKNRAIDPVQGLHGGLAGSAPI